MKKKRIKLVAIILLLLLVISFIILFLNRNNYSKENNTDTVKPTIKVEKESIDIFVGNELDIEKLAVCSDNKDKKIKCKFNGEVDTNTVGKYEVTVTAVDKAKNKNSKKITINVIENEEEPVVDNNDNNAVVNNNTSDTNPYYTEVIRNQNIVIVYGKDNNGNYTKVVKVFVCSVGSDNGTPTGTFTTTDKYVWRALFGGVYGQYATRITGSILFHSVPYTRQSKDSLEWEEYNKLGTAASMGCVRMAVRDVKWIYDNCPSGMTVKIYDGDIPNGISKPSSIQIDGDSPNRGWDPTDPDANNPW